MSNISSTENSKTSNDEGTSANNNNSNANSLINGKSARGRNAKKPPQSTVCTWCNESKTLLKYVLPTQTGKKEFCSESCIAEFRKAYNKGACIVCDNVLRSNAPTREYCSSFCLQKNSKRKSASTSSTSSTPEPTATTSAPSTSTTTTTTSPSKISLKLCPQSTPTNSNINNNNNINLTNNNNSSSKPKNTSLVETNNNSPKETYPVNRISPMFQYEAFHVFDWKEYLKVRFLFLSNYKSPNSK